MDDNQQLQLFTFHLPVQLTPRHIRELAAQAGIDLLGYGISDEVPKEELALLRARWILKMFELRAATRFGALMGEPGWTILLDLYVRDADGKKTNTTSAVMGSMAPQTTGLRWVHLLLEKGLIVGSKLEGKSTMIFLSLTADTRTEITDLLVKWPSPPL